MILPDTRTATATFGGLITSGPLRGTEFGPNGSYGDWEWHETLATRFGFSHIRSRENRQELENNNPENTQVRLADSLLLFNTGSLASGVTVQEADWESLSIDAGFNGAALGAPYCGMVSGSVTAPAPSDLALVAVAAVTAFFSVSYLRLARALR